MHLTLEQPVQPLPAPGPGGPGRVEQVAQAAAVAGADVRADGWAVPYSLLTRPAHSDVLILVRAESFVQ